MNTQPPPSHDSLISHTGRSYFPLAFVARIPYAMVVIGVLTIVVSARNSIELGGISSALVGIGAATTGPLIGAAADRFGQRITLLSAAAASSAVLVALAAVAYSALPDWTLLCVAFLTGATTPQISPLSRVRLISLIHERIAVARRPKLISVILAYESAADEVIFVFGPVIVGLLATTVGARTPIIAAAILTLLFVVAFALHPSGAQTHSAAQRTAHLAPVSSLFSPGVIVVVGGVFSVGLVFGSTLTSLTALLKDAGIPEAAGLLYGAMGVGSALLAVSAAFFSAKFTLRARWLSFSACVVAGAALYTQASDTPAIILSLCVMGIGIGPLLVSLFGLGTERSPAGRSATLMTMLGSGIVLGQSLAAALTGSIAAHAGSAASVAIPLGAALMTLLTGTANWFLSGRRPAAQNFARE